MKKRLVIISIAVFFLFSLLVAQYFKIQIIEGEKWTREALSQHEFIVREPFRRGAFYSNTSIKQGHPENPQPLVFDVTKFHLYIDPLSISEKFREEIAVELAKFIPAEKEVRQEFDKKSRSRRLCMWLDREVKESVLEWWVPYARERKIPKNALYFVSDYKRSYPFGKLLGQVLHTIRDMKDEQTQEGFPTGGLEAYFNEVLKGKLGTRKLLRSPLNHLEIDKVIEAPEDGADIYLTVNHCIQAIAEEELEKGVKQAGARGGWAIMMNPYTGEVMALAQYPFFDPMEYRDFFNDPEKTENAKVRAVSDAFELGSIMKPITLALTLQANKELVAAGKEKIFDPSEKIPVSRSIFPGRASKPLIDKPAHKALNMAMAIQKSSNVYMAQVIERVIGALGNDWYRNALVKTFGFDTKTGIELPGETKGMVPTPGKLHPNGALEWSTPTPYSLSLGYNILATSLQMLRAYCVFANEGYLVHPTLVRKIVKDDEILFDSVLHRKYQKVLDTAVAKEVLKSMKYTTKPGGTGSLAAINGYSEAGKSGTAEKIVCGAYSKKLHMSSFIGFAPASLDASIPVQFVLIVTLDEPAPVLIEGRKNFMAGRCSAPIFREIAKRTLEYLGVAPDDPFGYPAGDPRFDAEKADWLKELKELKVLYEQWNR